MAQKSELELIYSLSAGLTATTELMKNLITNLDKFEIKLDSVELDQVRFTERSESKLEMVNAYFASIDRLVDKIKDIERSVTYVENELKQIKKEMKEKDEQQKEDSRFKKQTLANISVQMLPWVVSAIMFLFVLIGKNPEIVKDIMNKKSPMSIPVPIK